MVDERRHSTSIIDSSAQRKKVSTMAWNDPATKSDYLLAIVVIVVFTAIALVFFPRL